MTEAPWLHIVRVDIDHALTAEFDRWYEQDHIPALLACPGWLSARRFTCADSPHHAAVYEIAGPWVYETPAFLAVKGFAHLAPHIRNFARQVLAPVGT